MYSLDIIESSAPACVNESVLRAQGLPTAAYTGTEQCLEAKGGVKILGQGRRRRGEGTGQSGPP